MGGGSSDEDTGSGSGGGSDRSNGTPSSGGITIVRPSYGSVTASPQNASKGDKVTLTVRPHSGYVLDSLTVKDSKGVEVELTKLSDTKYTFIMPDSQVTVRAEFVRNSPSVTVPGFYDVPDSHWANKEITWASANGVMNGTGGGAFSPDSRVNRQQTWMVLGRLAGANPANMAAAREWAVSNGISDGSNPLNPVSRQQLAALLYRYAQLEEFPVTDLMDLETCPDNNDVAPYAEDAMAWAVGKGIVRGTSDGRLAPMESTSRAQFAVIMCRFSQQVSD